MQTLFFPKLFCIINHNNAIKDIQTLLKSPEKSIKEIVNELEFPSSSGAMSGNTWVYPPDNTATI